MILFAVAKILEFKINFLDIYGKRAGSTGHIRREARKLDPLSEKGKPTGTRESQRYAGKIRKVTCKVDIKNR